jgi:HSP20 family protein
MTLVRTKFTNPNSFFWTTPTIFDNMIDEMLNTRPTTRQDSPVKISSLEDRTEISVAAPGVKKDEFEISVKEDTLTISYAQSTKENERSFSKNAFARSWSLPEGTKTKDITAKYNAGILTLSVKKPKKVEPKTHSIKVT